MTLEHRPRPQAPGAPGTEDQCSEQWWVQVAAGLLISMGFSIHFLAYISSWLPDWRLLEGRDHIFVHGTQRCTHTLRTESIIMC